MLLEHRSFQDENDYWRIRSFLRKVFLKNNRTEHSWNVARLDYWRWHVAANCGVCPSMEEVVHIWEDRNGNIRAVLNPESMGEAYLQIDPDARTRELEEEMLSMAEESLSSINEQGNRRLVLMVRTSDRDRQELLRSRGYSRGTFKASDWRLHLKEPLSVPKVPDGWTIRHQRPEDIPSRSWASWRAFHPDEEEEGYEGHQWYSNLEKIPLYRRDLDMLAIGPDNEVGGFCTIWYDDFTRTGYMEPVGRRPDVEVRGLMRALLLEACRRLQVLGGDLVTVGGSGLSSGTLYTSVFGPSSGTVESWMMDLSRHS